MVQIYQNKEKTEWVYYIDCKGKYYYIRKKDGQFKVYLNGCGCRFMDDDIDYEYQLFEDFEIMFDLSECVLEHIHSISI
jgi:hypothetical protein